VTASSVQHTTRHIMSFHRRSSQPISWLVKKTQPSQPITWLGWC